MGGGGREHLLDFIYSLIKFGISFKLNNFIGCGRFIFLFIIVARLKNQVCKRGNEFAVFSCVKVDLDLTAA